MSKFEHKVPLFPPGPLKKEMLLSLRDIALDGQGFRYREHTDGIVAGCRLIEDGMRIGVGEGMVKHAGRLYRLRGEALLPYEPTDEWAVIKLRFAPKSPHSEYDHHEASLALEAGTDEKPDEMELGRFKLKRGSRLRTEYEGFRDMATEYDTAILIHVRQAAPGADTLSPAITTHFAREAYSSAGGNQLDAAFCTACLSTGEAVARELIGRYACARLGLEYREMGNAELHGALAEILDLITGQSRDGKGTGQRGGVLLID